MEETKKINGRKKLPSIPANYVSLVQLQERWIKERKQKEKEKEKEENQEPEQEQGKKGNQNQDEERVDDEVDGIGSRKSGHLGRRDPRNWKRVADRKANEEEENSVALAFNGSEGFEEEKKGDKSKNKTKKWRNKKKDKKEEKIVAENEGEEVVATATNAPLPASVESNKVKDETIAEEVHAPKQESAEEENVEAKTEYWTVEIGRKFGEMSMKGEYRKGDHRRYWRQSGGFNHRGGNRELNGSYYGNFDRRWESKQRNKKMVWVKKGDGGDGNVGGIQS